MTKEKCIMLLLKSSNIFCFLGEGLQHGKIDIDGTKSGYKNLSQAAEQRRTVNNPYIAKFNEHYKELKVLQIQ